MLDSGKDTIRNASKENPLSKGRAAKLLLGSSKGGAVMSVEGSAGADLISEFDYRYCQEATTRYSSEAYFLNLNIAYFVCSLVTWL